MLQKFKDLLQLGALQFRKLFLSLDKFPCLNASLPHVLLLWLIPDLNQLLLKLLCCLKNLSVVWPYRLLPCIRCTRGLSSALERYKICWVPLPVRKPVSKQDLETTQLSVTESAETQLCVPQNIIKGITPYLLGKNWLGDYMYPGGPVSGKCDLIYAVEKSQVPRQFYQCTYNNSMITVTPDIIYLLSFLDLIFAGTLKTKKLEPNSTHWDIAQCSELVSQNIWVSHMSWGQISTKLVREVFMHLNCCSLCQLMQEAKESS